MSKSIPSHESVPVAAALDLPRLDGVRVLVLFGGSDLFGQERANIEVFSTLAELGLKARFVISSRWGDAQIRPELERRGFEVVSAPFGFHWTRHMLGKHFGYFLLNLMGTLLTSWRVWREVGHWRATHVYAPNWLHLTYAIAGIWLGRLPLIYRMGDKPPPPRSFQGRVLRWLWRRVTRAVGISHFIFASATNCGLAVEKMSVIHSHPLRRMLSQQETLPVAQAPVILYLGQMAAFKGVGLLAEAAARLAERGRHFELWLAGKSSWDNGFEAQLADQIQQLGLSDKTRRLGYVHDVDALFCRASIHVAPSICEEALGNVVLEAKANGVPSVVFPDGGLPELIENRVDGYVCADKSVEALMEGIDFFLRDPARREAAGRAARQSLDARFGAAEFQRQWARVFLETKRS